MKRITSKITTKLTIGYQSNNNQITTNKNEKNEKNEKNIIKENIKRKGKKEFLPPTLQEIESYVKEKSLNVNAKQFYDYFSEGNWIDAKGNKVKSWKQKILTWNSYSKPKPKEETEEEEIERKVKELKEMMGNG